MLYLENKYVGLLSSRLRNFKRKGGSLYNFSCPTCGDSVKDKRKARGYIYERGGHLFYRCHKCDHSTTMPRFLKELDAELYREYILEKFQDERRDRSESAEEYEKFVVLARTTPRMDDPTRGLTPWKDDDRARALVERRRLAPIKLYHTDQFWSWARSVAADPERFERRGDEGRLIIPFGPAGFQGRSYSDDGVRYVSVVVDPTLPFLHGLGAIDPSRPVYALEGPFDAHLVDNGVATGGGSIVAEVQKADLSGIVIVYDNEPRSVQTVGKMHKALEAGYPIVVWPTSQKEKDVNDLIMAGRSRADVMDVIRRRTFSGLSASLAIAEWKRVQT